LIPDALMLFVTALQPLFGCFARWQDLQQIRPYSLQISGERVAPLARRMHLPTIAEG